MDYIIKGVVKNPEGYTIKTFADREAILADYPELGISVSYAADAVFLLFPDKEVQKDAQKDAENFVIDTAGYNESEIRNLINEYKKYLSGEQSRFNKLEV